MMAKPGKIARCGASSRFWRPSFSIAPHEGLGGWAESPRKESAASVSTAHERAMLACTMSLMIESGSFMGYGLRCQGIAHGPGQSPLAEFYLPVGDTLNDPTSSGKSVTRRASLPASTT